MTLRRGVLLLLGTLFLASPAWAFENNSDVKALQTAAGATGDGLPLDVSQYSTVAVQVTLSNTATITWEGSTHTSYSSISCTNKATAASATTTTATGLYQCDVAGLSTFRARISAWTSGTVDVIARASTATASSSSTISGGAGDASAANQTTMIGHVDGLEDGIGLAADAVGTSGAQGTLNSKIRLMTAQLANIQTASQLMDNIVSGTGANISQINGVTPLMGAGNTGTGSPRVTIATDQEALTVTDGAGAMNVICDSGCSGGSQYVEDAAETAAANLTMAGSVRRDTAASSADTTGDNATINTDSTGLLWTRVGIEPMTGVEDAAETAGGDLKMIGSVRRDTAASSAGTTGDNATINTDATGNLWVTGTGIEDVAETAGGSLGMAGTVRRDTPASSAGTTGDNATLNTNSLGALYIQPSVGPTGGATTLSYISVGVTEDEHAICTAACTLYSISVTNINAAVRYLKCENDTAAGTAPGTDTPELRIAIPGATTGAGNNLSIPAVGMAFSTGLTCWIVTGAADSDVAEVAANEIMVNYSFKQ